MADSPSSASSLDAIPRRANEEAEEEIPSASATPTHMFAFEYRSAIEAIDAQLPDEENEFGFRQPLMKSIGLGALAGFEIYMSVIGLPFGGHAGSLPARWLFLSWRKQPKPAGVP